MQGTITPTPHSKMLIFFNMPPSFYGSNPLVLHHSLASTLHIYSYNDIHNYSAKLLAQRKNSTTSQVVKKQQPPTKTPTGPLLPSSYSLLCLLHPFLPPNHLQCNSLLHHPSCHVIPILHNTQTNRIAYPRIPYSSDGEIPTARMQKGDG
jgi:hypothetical protein